MGYTFTQEDAMEDSILNWLLEDENPEVKLRTLKEALHLSDSDEKVIECKKQLLESKTYARALNRLGKPKNWDKYDAILAFAEWGLTRADIGKAPTTRRIVGPCPKRWRRRCRCWEKASKRAGFRCCRNRVTKRMT